MNSSLFICALLIFACGEKEPEEAALSKEVSFSPETNNRGEACIAFVDMSKSLPEDAFARELENLKKIFLKLSEDAESFIQVYPLHGNVGRGVPAIVNCVLQPNPYSGDRRLTELYRQKRRNDWQDYEKRIRELRQSLRQAHGDPLSRTCIIDAFSYVQRFFKSKHNLGKKSFVLVSDMLEDCPARHIDMDNTAEEFRRSVNVANNDTIKNADFLKAIEIKIMAPGGPNGILALPEGVSVTELEDFWQKIFIRLGADEANISFEII